MAECRSLDDVVEFLTLKQLKQRRAGYLSDVTKKQKLCEDALVDERSLAAVKHCVKAY